MLLPLRLIIGQCTLILKQTTQNLSVVWLGELPFCPSNKSNVFGRVLLTV